MKKVKRFQKCKKGDRAEVASFLGSIYSFLHKNYAKVEYKTSREIIESYFRLKTTKILNEKLLRNIPYILEKLDRRRLREKRLSQKYTVRSNPLRKRIYHSQFGGDYVLRH